MARSGWKARRQYSLLLACVFGIVDRLRRPLSALGIDFPRFRAILELKLLLDMRPGAAPGLDAGLVSGGFALALTGAWLVGFFPGVLSFFDVAPVLWMTLVQTVVLGVVVFFLLAQYGPILVDSTDVGIVAPLPVPDRTLFAARLAHVMVYVSLLAACTASWAAFLGPWGLRSWIVPFVVVPCSIGTTLLGVALVGILYGAVLRLCGARSFQRFTFWVQIAMLSALVGGLQLVNAVVPWTRLAAWVEQHAWAGLFWPPAHSAAVLRVCMEGWSAADVAPVALAALVPLAALVLALKLASRHFVDALAGDLERPTPRRSGWPRGAWQRFGRRQVTAGPERAGYGLAIALCKRDRTYLRAALPGLAPIAMVGLMSAFFARGFTSEGLRGLAPLTLWAQPLCAAVLFELLRVSEHANARWLVRAAPCATPGPLLAGTVRGALVLLYVPVLVVLALVIWLTNPTPVAAVDVLVAGCGALAMGLWAARRMHLRAPFCYTPKPSELDLANLPPVVMIMAASGAAALVHGLLRLVPYAQALALLAIVPAVVVGWRKLALLEPVEPVPE